VYNVDEPHEFGDMPKNRVQKQTIDCWCEDKKL